jgi:hypothetical protein
VQLFGRSRQGTLPFNSAQNLQVISFDHDHP